MQLHEQRIGAGHPPIFGLFIGNRLVFSSAAKPRRAKSELGEIRAALLRYRQGHALPTRMICKIPRSVRRLEGNIEIRPI